MHKSPAQTSEKCAWNAGKTNKIWHRLLTNTTLLHFTADNGGIYGAVSRQLNEHIRMQITTPQRLHLHCVRKKVHQLLSKLTDFNHVWHVRSWENLTWPSYRFLVASLQMSVALKRTGCYLGQLECQASNVTASVQSDHILHEYMLPVFCHCSIASRNKPLPQLVGIIDWYSTHALL